MRQLAKFLPLLFLLISGVISCAVTAYVLHDSASAQGQTQTELLLNTQNQTVSVGEEFVVFLGLTTPHDTYAIDSVITFNSDIFEVISVRAVPEGITLAPITGEGQYNLEQGVVVSSDDPTQSQLDIGLVAFDPTTNQITQPLTGFYEPLHNPLVQIRLKPKKTGIGEFAIVFTQKKDTTGSNVMSLVQEEYTDVLDSAGSSLLVHVTDMTPVSSPDVLAVPSMAIATPSSSIPRPTPISSPIPMPTPEASVAEAGLKVVGAENGSLGEDLRVSVELSTQTKLKTIAFSINYNPRRLRAVEIIGGRLFSTPVKSSINAGSGVIEIEQSVPVTTKSEITGALATIVFRPLSVGKTRVSAGNLELADKTGKVVSVDTDDVSIVIEQPKPQISPQLILNIPKTFFVRTVKVSAQKPAWKQTVNVIAGTNQYPVKLPKSFSGNEVALIITAQGYLPLRKMVFVEPETQVDLSEMIFGDLNSDGQINMLDLATLYRQWRQDKKTINPEMFALLKNHMGEVE